MATILKIVYAMILFISLFLVAMNVDGKSFFLSFSNSPLLSWHTQSYVQFY